MVNPLTKPKHKQAERVILKADIERYRFIHLGDTYYVVDIIRCTCIEMVEIYQLRRSNSKSVLNYYC